MSNLENILRSIPGYILNPAETYERNRNEGYFYAIAIFFILYAAIFLLSGLLLVIYDILSGRTNDPQFFLLWFGLYGLFRSSVEIPVIVFIIHFASKLGNKKVGFADSFKIAFVGYAFFIFIIGLITVIDGLLRSIFSVNYAAGLKYFVDYPLYILATLFFIRVAAEGIRALHGLSKRKSYAIAVISILAAYFAMRLVLFLIVDLFLV
ncbi:MAG: hypothetical protein JW931_09930 [Methanomicrobiaceae archaeon]|nr:hypothetical protein [Methanomicrobiaceae archaeon]